MNAPPCLTDWGHQLISIYNNGEPGKFIIHYFNTV